MPGSRRNAEGRRAGGCSQAGRAGACRGSRTPAMAGAAAAGGLRGTPAGARQPVTAQRLLPLVKRAFSCIEPFSNLTLLGMIYMLCMIKVG